ncbi:hypothetical protein CR513_35694, partial [Mucuna pruriens]
MTPSGDLFEDAPGPSTQGDQSPAEATLNAGFEAPRDEPAGSSSGSFDSYPFEVWYRDDTRDYVDEDPQGWVDPEVKKMSSLLTRSSALLGMVKAICQRDPWSVRVSPCRSGESVSTALLAEGKPYFYLYDTLNSKTGIKLPFSHFERAVLQVLNVAPTQLHPNSWEFVRAFELLYEDLGKAPTLGVFFWFYTVKKADKVGWTSLCSRPKRKLFKPFLASYKKFKSHFFKVTPSNSSPNLLVDRAGRPFFPLTWTHQPVVSISIHLKDLEIGRINYSSRALRELKRKATLMAEEEEQQAAASAEPIAAAEPSPQRAAIDEASNALSLVVLNEPASPSPIVGKTDDSSSPRSEERLSKHQHVEKPVAGSIEVGKGSRPSNDFQWDTLLSGHPSSSSVRGPPSLLGQAVDKGLASSSESNKIKQLGVAGTCKTLQQYAAYSLILARAAEKEFGRLEFQSRSCAERVEKIETEFLNLSKAYAEVEVKINSYRSANAALEEDLQRTIAKNKDLVRVNFELDMAVDSANAEAGILKQKNEGLEASNSDLREKLASAESLLKQALEDIQSRDQTILAQSQTIKAHERTVIKMGSDIVHQYEAGFAKALEQVRFLHPNADVSEADPFKEFVDSQLVLTLDLGSLDPGSVSMVVRFGSCSFNSSDPRS